MRSHSQDFGEIVQVRHLCAVKLERKNVCKQSTVSSQVINIE